MYRISIDELQSARNFYFEIDTLIKVDTTIILFQNLATRTLNIEKRLEWYVHQSAKRSSLMLLIKPSVNIYNKNGVAWLQI